MQSHALPTTPANTLFHVFANGLITQSSVAHGRTYVDRMLARLEDEWMGEDYDMLEVRRPKCSNTITPLGSEGYRWTYIQLYSHPRASRGTPLAAPQLPHQSHTGMCEIRGLSAARWCSATACTSATP